MEEDIIRAYFEMWLKKDCTGIENIFYDNILYVECYGPVYKGLSQVKTWFADWNKAGKVICWDIKQIIVKDNVAVCEWYFDCEYESDRSAFDGVSIFEFNDSAKVCSIREFRSEHIHTMPYGDVQ